MEFSYITTALSSKCNEQCRAWMAGNADVFRMLLEDAFADPAIYVTKTACSLLTMVCCWVH